MKKNKFKYNPRTSQLWLNDKEITKKSEKKPGDCFFVLEETPPRHWIRLKLTSDSKQLKAFAKQPKENGELSYFEVWHPIETLLDPIVFQFSPTDETEKKPDGKWGKKYEENQSK